MRKGLIAAGVMILVLGFAGFTLAHEMTRGGRHMMGGGQKGQHGMMGPGMGPMMSSPEIMGTMMSIHGEIMSLMGKMMQKYGHTMGQMTPELRQQMQQEMLNRMGEILTKSGMALKEKAKAAGK